MPNLNAFIYPASEYKIFITLNNGVPFLLQTCESLSGEIKMEDETIWGIGSQSAIGEKRNKKSFSGSLRVQNGELNALLLAGGLTDATQIENATISVAALPTTQQPIPFSRVFQAVNFNTEKFDIKAGDNQTLTDVDWKAISIL